MDKLRKKFIDALKERNTSEIIMDMDKRKELEKIFPHIIEMKKIGKCKFHTVDSFTHSINALKELECELNTDGFFPSHLEKLIKEDMDTEIEPGINKRALLRLSAFLHDIGKPRAMTVDENGEAHFKGHEYIGAEMLDDVLKDFNLSMEAMKIVYTYVRYHMTLLEFYISNDLNIDLLYNTFRNLKKEIIGTMMIGYADVVSTRRLIFENEDYGVLEIYMDYVLTSYYYRFKEK